MSDSRIDSSSVVLFRSMVTGSMGSFVKQFGKLIWDTMPKQFLGSREYVYQAYVCAFFTAASAAAREPSNLVEWEVQVEQCAGIGRLDLILQRLGVETGVLHEYKREMLSDKDKKEGYGDAQKKRLTKMAEEALAQLETRGYRALMRDHVTNLREYGFAFLGPYCAVVGRSLKREPGGQWMIRKTYDSTQDEKRRAQMYRSRSR